MTSTHTAPRGATLAADRFTGCVLHAVTGRYRGHTLTVLGHLSGGRTDSYLVLVDGARRAWYRGPQCRNALRRRGVVAAYCET